MTETSIQEAGQFAGAAPLTGHNIQGHSINAMLAKGVPEEVLRFSVTHYGTRGLFGKAIQRTSKHDRDNVRRKKWRAAQSFKPKVEPKPSSQLDDDEWRDQEGGSGRNRGVPPPFHNAPGSVNIAEKKIHRPLPPPNPYLLLNDVKTSSSPPYSTQTRLSEGGALNNHAYLRPEGPLGLASEGARSTSADCRKNAPLGSLGSHRLPTITVEKRYIMYTPSVALEAPRASWKTVAHMRDPLPYPPPSQLMDSPGLCTRDSTTIGTAIWAAAHQRRHSRHLYVPATATSRASRCQQWRGPAGEGPESTTGAQRACGPLRATRATLYHHAPGPYPSPSHRSASGHVYLSRSSATAESSTVAECVGYGITPPIAVAGVHQAQVYQDGGTPLQTHAQHDHSSHLSMGTSPSHARAVNPSFTPPTYMTSTPLVKSANQHRFGAPTTNAQQRSQLACTSASTYSELAHALVDRHSVAPPATVGAEAVQASLYVPLVQSGAIASPTMGVPGSLAWHDACWQNDLPTAPQPIFNYLPTHPILNAAITPGTSRAHTSSNNERMPRKLKERFDNCKPSWSDIMAPPPLGADVANGRDIDRTHLKASSSASGNDFPHQLRTTSTWQEAHSTRITHITIPQALPPP